LSTLGIDGCRAGWLGIWHKPTGYSWRIEASIRPLVYTSGCRRAFIDIPIGLSSNERRGCDTAAREFLGRAFSSSVFPTPVRGVLAAKTYELANARHRQISGRGLSKQSFFILPKIREVDSLLREDKQWQGRLREAHPEVAFKAVNGVDLRSKKKTAAGFKERLDLLSTLDPTVPELVDEILSQTKRSQVLPDDVLDAICLAVMPRAGRLKTLPKTPDVDSKGLPMEICYFER
jgi:predicted RNase H-like nuclease